MNSPRPSFAKIAPAFGLALIVFWINNIPGIGDTAGKQAATVLMLLGMLYIHLVFAPSYKTSDFVWVFFAYASYILLRNICYYLFNPNVVIWNDLAETTRLAGMSLAYLMGAASSSHDNKLGWRRFCYLYVVVSVILLALWFVGPAGFGKAVEFYITREGRFSHLVPSVNYVWAPSLVAIGISLLLVRTESLKDKALFTGVLLVSILSLILSGGRASIAAFLLGMTLMLFAARIVPLRSTVFVALSIAGVSVLFDFSEYLPATFDRFVSRMIEIYDALSARDLSEVHAFSVREQHWSDVWETSKENSIFGAGSSKSGIRVTDNSILMTFYRYGLIGVCIELLLFGVIVYNALVRGIRHPAAPILLGFVGAFFVSGITSSPMYELKTPYLLMFLVGWVTTVTNKTQIIWSNTSRA